MLSEQILACSACPLRDTCAAPVPGTYAPRTRLLVVAHSPDNDADLLGRPLAGRSGDLLHRLLHEAGFDPQTEVSWTYLVKCQGKDLADHRRECRHWLEQEVSSLRPRVILALGLTPCTSLLSLPSAQLKELAGQVVSTPLGTIACWHAEGVLLNRVGKLKKKTVTFLRSLPC